MKWIKKWSLVLVSAIMMMCVASCYDDDNERGYILQGRWFGDLQMEIDGLPAMGSDVEFIPEDYSGGYSHGYGYERDYYRTYRGVQYVVHDFEWTISNGIIYMRFDNADLDCEIRDYHLSYDMFRGYMDGIYNSVSFKLYSYGKYWGEYGYYSNYWDDWGYDYYESNESYDLRRAGGKNTDGQPHVRRKVNVLPATDADAQQ